MRPAICDFFSLPDLQKTKNLLCIQPHPDDMEIGAGATIARLRQTGTEISVLTVTDGAAGTYDPTMTADKLSEIRKKETRNSSDLLGVKELFWLDFPDGGDLPYDLVRGEITRVIRQVKPDGIMVCDPWLPYEVHTDHIRTGLAAAEAAFLANMPNFCPADLQDGLTPHAVELIAFYYTAYPNTFIAAGDNWAVKLEAIGCHQSQFPPQKMEQLSALLTEKAKVYSKEETGKEPVEAFKVLSPSHLHIFEEAWRC